MSVMLEVISLPLNKPSLLNIVLTDIHYYSVDFWIDLPHTGLDCGIYPCIFLVEHLMDDAIGRPYMPYSISPIWHASGLRS